MAWRYHSEYSPDPYNGRARGICDRCSFTYYLHDLIFQYDYRGNALINTRFRVCQKCLDVPYQGNRPVNLPADPVPVLNARPDNLFVDEGNGPVAPPNNTPIEGYTTEDGKIVYVAEDGTTTYVPE